MNKNNIFAAKNEWFRHTDYKIVENEFNGEKFKSIKPGEHSKIQWYDPFKEFPDILKDFFDKLLVAINDKNDYSNNLLEFTKMYGPLGIYWLDIENPNQKNDWTNLLIASMLTGEKNIDNWSEFLIKKYFLTNHEEVLKYLKDFRPFFQPLNEFSLNNEEKYHFRIIDIIENNSNNIIDKHVLKLLKGYSETPLFLKQNPKLSKFSKIFNNASKKEELFINEDIGITYKDDFAQLTFDCSTLLDALLSMHIMNEAKQTGKYKLKFCQNDKCDNSFIVGPKAHNSTKKYCDNASCGNKKRVFNSRYRHGFNHLYHLPKLIKGDTTIDRLIESQNVSKQNIINAIKDYKPKSKSLQNKLSKYKENNNIFD